MATRDEIREVVARVVDATLHRVPAPEEAVAALPAAALAATTIAIGSDHRGYALKERLAFRLREAGHEVIDVGTHSAEAVDYPDFAFAVARRVAAGDAGSGIVVDGAGIGSAMVANKVAGVRAAMCYDVSSAINSREHNHANVLTLGAGSIGDALAWQIVEAWLATPWAEGRHARRVAKITDIERGEMGGR